MVLPDLQPTAVRPEGAQLEVEAVLDVDQVFAVPDLTGRAGVTWVQHTEPLELQAVYHDTAQLTLLRAGVTLRLRTGGVDDGWHLKLPWPASGAPVAGVGTTGARLELHRPATAGSSGPPAALLALVQALLRGHPVLPLARVLTHRERQVLHGEEHPLAELADDRVAVEVAVAPSEGAGTPPDWKSHSQWREVEVELLGGDTEVLADLTGALVEAGARPSSTPSKVGRALAGPLNSRAAELIARPESAPPRHPKRRRRAEPVLGYLAQQLADVVRLDPQVRLEVPGAVEALRAAVCRVEATLHTFEALFTGAEPARLRAEVAWLVGLLESAPVPVVVRGLDSARYARLLDDLEHLVAEPPLAGGLGPVAEGSLDPVLLAALAGAHRRVHKARRAVDGRPDHALLVAVRHSRCAAELIAPFGGAAADRYLAAVQHVQAALEGRGPDPEQAWQELRTVAAEWPGRTAS